MDHRVEGFAYRILFNEGDESFYIINHVFFPPLTALAFAFLMSNILRVRQEEILDLGQIFSAWGLAYTWTLISIPVLLLPLGAFHVLSGAIFAFNYFGVVTVKLSRDSSNTELITKFFGVVCGLAVVTVFSFLLFFLFAGALF